MLAVRSAIPVDERAPRAAAIEAGLFGLPQARGERAWLLYWAFGSEVPTRAIVARALAEGRTVALPVLRDDRLEAAVLDRLEATALRIRPERAAWVDGRSTPEEIGLVVVPGVAFDRRGHRLGRGGGHYDRFLRDIGSGPPRVAIAFHEQLVDGIPTSRWTRTSTWWSRTARSSRAGTLLPRAEDRAMAATEPRPGR